MAETKSGKNFIGARFTQETADRIDEVAAAMKRHLRFPVSRAAVLEACVEAMLPKMEEQWLTPKDGIVLLEPPDPPKE